MSLKRAALAAWCALALTLALPPLLRPAARPQEPPTPPEETEEPAGAEADQTGLLRFWDGSELRELRMADYLLGALAAEMPAAFETEALKAQATALRTYALYGAAHPKAKHPEAAVCGDSACCAAWLDEEERAARWGADAQTWTRKLQEAIAATDGQYLVWEGEPVLAVFHASSGGSTENGSALGLSAPYLRSVASPETEAEARGLHSTVELAPSEFAETLRAAAPEKPFDFSAAPGEWLGPLTLDAAGRVASAELGGQQVSGLALRQCFGLRSTDFTLAYDGEKFVFRVRGYGHGLGMSQCGAQRMALDGADYTEILAHYYPGTELVT